MPEHVDVGSLKSNSPVTRQDNKLDEFQELLKSGLMPGAAMEYVILDLAGNLLALSGEILEGLFDVLIIEIYGAENKLDESDLAFKNFDCLLAGQL